jgi:hypothetical protein
MRFRKSAAVRSSSAMARSWLCSRCRCWGLFSDRPYTEVLAKREEMQNAANALGCTLVDPFLKLEFAFAAAEFPHLRMSEEGLIRTKARERLSVELEDAAVSAK